MLFQVVEGLPLSPVIWIILEIPQPGPIVFPVNELHYVHGSVSASWRVAVTWYPGKPAKTPHSTQKTAFAASAPSLPARLAALANRPGSPGSTSSRWYGGGSR